MTSGIHHITAISSNPQQTYNFYSEVLGLRMVKKTVNFDSPDTYHFYFGSYEADPGTLLTFFPFERAGTGMRGVGQATKIQLAIPLGSLSYWLDRLRKFNVKASGVNKEFDLSTITFYDLDGLQLQLVMTDTSKFPAHEPNAIAGVFGVELSVDSAKETSKLLSDMGYNEAASAERIVRLQNQNAGYAKFVDVFEMKGWPKGITSAGTVHHVAFRVKNDTDQAEVHKLLSAANLKPTEVIDRHYFKSVYFSEPGGVLFEIATDGPGFTVDEPLEALGTGLMIPPQYQHLKMTIQEILPEIQTNHDASDLGLFTHKWIPGNSSHVMLLLHGTGGDERDLIPIAQQINPDAGILSLRGNVVQSGMNRFFRRNFETGEYDIENLHSEIDKLFKFITAAKAKYGIEPGSLIGLGYSNGANMILQTLLAHDAILDTAVLLHPTRVPHAMPEVLLSGKSFLITSGEKDEFLESTSDIDDLSRELKEAGADARTFVHEGTHRLDPREIEAAKQFVSEFRK